MNLQSIARDFDRDGFVVVRDVFTKEQVNQIERELQSYITTVAPTLDAGEVYYEDSAQRPVKAMHGLNRHSEFFNNLRSDANLLNLLRALWPDGQAIPENVSYFGKPARDGSVTPAHQDNFFQHWEPPLALTVTISIDPSTPRNGALICAKGSHRKLLPHHYSGVMGFSMTLDDPIDTEQFPEEHLCLQPGDIAILHIAVIHRSEPNRSDDSRRQLAIGYRSSLARKNQEAAARHKRMLEELHAKHK
ncbi:MAG: phytanoyl-CoA dioxygenase family protein [Phycisphaerales bacterium]|nr:phytanoyl-CoA dioxygenase family protein [Phycisphaerales bacterium]